MNLGGDEDDIDTSVEDSILDQVEEATGVSFDDDEEIQEPETIEHDPEEKVGKREESADKQAAPQAERPRQEPTNERVDRDQVQRWISARRRVDYDYNKRGDVVDPAGNVIFRRGDAVRDVFTALKDEQFKHSRLRTQAEQMAGEFSRQKTNLDAYDAAFKVAKDAGLTIQDQALAMENMAAFRKDPIQGIRGILHRFVVDGGDLSDIFDEVPKLQQAGLEERLKGLADRIEAPQRQEASAKQAQETISKEIQTFFVDNPLAEIHSDTLGHIIRSGTERGERVSLTQAWIRLMQFCNEKGLRLDAPLQAQLSDEPVQQQRQERPAQRPMPGRGRSNGLAPKQSSKPSYERSSRDIVDEAMREAGFID